jgi:hypothetical protein
MDTRRASDARLNLVMSDISATNRTHDFAYFNAAGHIEFWRRGDAIPSEAFDSTTFPATVHNWGKRVEWHRDDRQDDQTQSLMQMAAQLGRSTGLVRERMFFDLLTGTASFLPSIPNAPDGVGFFSATDGASAARFGVTGGNLLTGSGVTSLSAVRADYYAAYEQFKQFQDGKGQPLFTDDIVDSGMVIIHSAADTEVFEEAFIQRRQGILLDNGTDPATGSTPSNLVQDASRNVTLWGTSRLATGDWYAFLRGAPVMPTFFLDRQGVIESQALEGDNNSDMVRDTKTEYTQWDLRAGAGIALPYGAIKIDN